MDNILLKMSAVIILGEIHDKPGDVALSVRYAAVTCGISLSVKQLFCARGIEAFFGLKLPWSTSTCGGVLTLLVLNQASFKIIGYTDVEASRRFTLETIGSGHEGK